MKTGCIVLLFTVLFAGCKKENKEEKAFEAHYNGTFHRIDFVPADKVAGVGVSLHFSDNHFSGDSYSKNFPAICQGKYTISQSKINVENTCAFTTDFDGSLIFKGEYNYEVKGDSLRIWRDYEAGYTDIYLLRKVND